MYSPFDSVTAVREPCNCGLVTVTVTPGRGAPDASVTIPVSAPVVRDVCAVPIVATSRSATGAMNNRKTLFMYYLPKIKNRRAVSARRHPRVYEDSQVLDVRKVDLHFAQNA